MKRNQPQTSPSTDVDGGKQKKATKFSSVMKTIAKNSPIAMGADIGASLARNKPNAGAQAGRQFFQSSSSSDSSEEEDENNGETGENGETTTDEIVNAKDPFFIFYFFIVLLSTITYNIF